MADFGYDISDYTGIDPLFGTMADFDALIEAAHAAGLKLILDLVRTTPPTSIPGSSRAEARAIIRSATGICGATRSRMAARRTTGCRNSAAAPGRYDDATGQYYYHAFLAQQPDLNWRNPEVREAIYDVMRFWLRKGVDGFRVDVIWHLIKDAQFRDNPPNPYYREGRPPHERS